MKYLLDGEESERLRFRKIEESDFHDWLEFFRDPGAHLHWKEDRSTAEQDCRKWYDKQFWRYDIDRGGMNALIEKASGKLVGHCGLVVQEVDDITELEVAYSLLPSYWSRGFASEAAKKCRDFAFQNELAVSLISIISITNEPSIRVAVRNGMSKEKTTGYKGNEVFIYRIGKADWALV